MRLMDLLADPGGAAMTVSDGGRRFELPGTAVYAAAIQACPTRYVLDDQVARLCESLLETDVGMLDPANIFLRLQARTFWLEWFRERSLPGSDVRDRQKVGCLIDAAADGRRGALHSFWIDEADRAQAGQVFLEFDLDQQPAGAGCDARRAVHEQVEFQPLLEHVVVRVEPQWLPYFTSLSLAGRDLFIGACAARIWFDLPMAFAFATLLGTESYLAATRSDLSKLNRSRAAHGRPALLDHIETRLLLGRAAEHGSRGTATRSTPRLHSVRGHMVRRHDATFWRMTHLRGDPVTSQLTKTVSVGHRPGV